MRTRTLRWGAAVCLATLGAGLSAAAPASANHEYGCENFSLIGGDGTKWNIGDDGPTGSFKTTENTVFDEEIGEIFFGSGMEYFYEPSGPQSTAPVCTVEDDGQEFVWPATMASDLIEDRSSRGADVPEALEYSQKLYVPWAAKSFARQLHVFKNTSDQPISFDFANASWLNSDDCKAATRGCGSGIELVDSSEGVSAAGPADMWMTLRFFDNEGALAARGGQPGDWNDTGLVAWQGLGRTDSADDVHEWDDWPATDGFTDGDNDLITEFRDVKLAPGEAAIYMVVFAERGDANDAANLGRELVESPGYLFAGMTDAEINAVRNFRAPDSDGDGRTDTADNCRNAANADQADLDRDGQGDACDDDIDGDGMSNALEASMTTDPRKADSDGDGIGDGADQCPTLAGPGGCPAPQTTLASTGLGVPTGVTLNVTSTRAGANASGAKARVAQSSGVTIRSSGRIQLAQGTSTTACALGRVAVVVKDGKRTISTRIVDVRSDCTYRSSVRFTRKLGRQLKVKSYFFGSRGLVGRAAKQKIVTIR